MLAKFETLITLCDRLEASLTRTNRYGMVEALLQKALAAATKAAK